MIINSENKNYAAIGFGEVMMRLSPAAQERIAQGDEFIKHAGGSELNVISGISRLGLRTALISKIPDSVVGRFIRNSIRSYGVSDNLVVLDPNPKSRLGIYYYESGGFPRKPNIVYDRANSSFTTMTHLEIEPTVYEKTSLFHTSGITLALGKEIRQTAIEMVKKFSQCGAAISFDVNYRATLWSEEEARDTIKSILPYIDILFVSEETSRRMMQKTGTLEEIQKSYCEEYGIKVVASTQRKIISPRSHTFGSLLYAAETGVYYQETPYENIEVLDRIGSGDAYVSGVLYSLISNHGYQNAVAFGNAMSALKNTIAGDFLATDRHEIKAIIDDHHSTGIKSEMNR